VKEKNNKNRFLNSGTKCGLPKLEKKEKVGTPEICNARSES